MQAEAATRSRYQTLTQAGRGLEVRAASKVGREAEHSEESMQHRGGGHVTPSLGESWPVCLRQADSP